MTRALGGQYHLVERIGKGGMAEVWKAISRGPAGFEKVVVIKRVLPHLARSEQFVAMLIREAKIAARLSHANIVQIFDLGVDGDSYFIAMEHVDGPNLAELLMRAGRRHADVPLALRLHLAAEIAKGLDFAHRQRDEQGRPLGIVHRDVSPSNVLLSREGEVKLADFGIATARAAEMLDRDRGRIRGKVSYMSPEQARGLEVDHRSDIFSLGVVLFELASGRRLFRGADTRETLRRVRTVAVPRLADVAPGLPADLSAVVDKALSQDPEDRQQSAGEVHAALSALVFSLGRKVDHADLAALVTGLSPKPRGRDPNKLAVDLLIRALDDATGVASRDLTRSPTGGGDTPGPARESATSAEVPASRRPDDDIRQVALLAVRLARGSDRPTVERAIRETGGHLVVTGELEVTALYGYPRAAENAPERAVRAALEIRRRSTESGPDSGLLLPAATVSRATVALASAAAVTPAVSALMRPVQVTLDGLAPGDVVVSTEVAPLLETTFQLRGSATPGLWHVVGLRRRSERIALASAGSGPIVGRDAELQRVLRLLSSVCEGRGRVLLLEGEAGSGKSRLLFELRNLVRQQGIGFRIGRCEAQSRGSPYGAIVDLVRDICGTDESDDLEERHAKVNRLRHLGLSPREIRIVGGLLGLRFPVDEERDLRGRPRVLWVIEAMGKMLNALGRDAPQIVALEDTQWLDESSGDVVRTVARAVPGARVLLLLTHRPGRELAVSDDLADRLVLRPVDSAAARELAAHGLGADMISNELADWITARAGGNPGLIVELCRMLRDSDAVEVRRRRARPSGRLDDIDVPGSVRDLVAATLDEIPKGERRLLRAAAVVGGAVDAEGVRHVSQLKASVVGSKLKALERRGLLVPVERAADVAGQRYVFRHELVRQGVVAGIGAHELRELHRRAAEHLERRGGDLSGDRATRLAEHLAAAGEVASAATLLERVAKARIEEGEPGAAAYHLARAANILGGGSDVASMKRAAALGLAAADALREAGQRDAARRWYVQARELAEVGDVPLVLIQALGGEASLALLAGEPALARTLLTRASGAAEALAERELGARIAVELGRALMQLGEPAEAAAQLSRAASAGEVLGDDALLCRAKVLLASARVMEERFDEAGALLDEVTERALRSRDAAERLEALVGLGELAVAQGRLEEAAERFAAARDVALRHDLVIAESRATLLAAEVQVLLRNPARAHALAAEVAHSAQALGLAGEAAFARVILGYLDATELDEADGLRKLAGALKELEATGRRAEAAMGHVLLGWAFRKHGSVPAARRALAAAAELAGSAFAPAARRLAKEALAELDASDVP